MAKRQNGLMVAEVIEDFQRARLADVADVIRGVTYKKDDARSKPENGVVPILRANNIQDGALELDGELVYVPSELIGKEQLLREGDIVIATSSGSKDLVGKAAPMRTRWMGSFGAFCAAVRPKDDIDPLYLAHFFEGPEYKALIRDKALGVNINNLRRGDLEELQIPLPPLPQQRRIVEAIELQLGRLDAAVARLQGAKARLKRYKQAVLKAAVDEAADEAEGLVVRLDEVADLCLGKMLDKQKNKGTPHPYLRNINVRWDSFDTDDLHQMPFQDHEHERYGLEVGDLVVCEGGEPGRCAVWDGSIPDMKIQKALHRVRCSSQADPHFVMYSLLYSAWSGSITKYYTGTTIKHLTGKSLAGFQLVLPSTEVQRRLVAGVRKAFGATDEMDATLDAQLQQAVRLRQAVLKRAFEGRLV